MPLPAAHYWLPWMPDFAAGVQDAPTDLASLADSISGAEERAVWLPRARRSLAFRLAPRDVATGVRMADNLRAALVTGRASLPHWGRGRVLSAYAPGSAVVTTALHHGLVAGSMAALYRPGDDSARLVEVYAVASAVQLTLTAPIPAGWAGVVWLAPVLHGRMGNASWSALSDLRSISVEFAELPPPPVPVPAWSAFERDFSYFWGLSAADFLVIRATWSDGYDLDTRTAIIDSGTALDGDDVGWNRGSTVELGGHTALTWGGDNTGNPGVEAIWIDFKKLKLALPGAATIKVRFRAFWYGAPGSGLFRLSVSGYLGGVMTQVGTNFVNEGGASSGELAAMRHPTLHVSSNVDGQDMATITFQAASGLATVALA